MRKRRPEHGKCQSDQPKQKQPRPQRSGASVTATTQQDQTATAYLERSVASDPSDHQAWYLLGKCCTRQKQYQKAFRAYEQAVLRAYPLPGGDEATAKRPRLKR